MVSHPRRRHILIMTTQRLSYLTDFILALALVICPAEMNEGEDFFAIPGINLS
jgi:hypothetical protein